MNRSKTETIQTKAKEKRFEEKREERRRRRRTRRRRNSNDVLVVVDGNDHHHEDVNDDDDDVGVNVVDNGDDDDDDIAIERDVRLNRKQETNKDPSDRNIRNSIKKHSNHHHHHHHHHRDHRKRTENFPPLRNIRTGNEINQNFYPKSHHNHHHHHHSNDCFDRNPNRRSLRISNLIETTPIPPRITDFDRKMSKVEILFQVIRFILVILFSIIFIISTIYFIRAIDAIGDDVEEARETHFGHEIEENDFLGIPINPKFDPYEDYEANPNDRLKIGRLVKKNRPDQLKHPHYRITNSRYKQQHIVSLIIWVVLTLFCAILSLAGVLGALFLNPCMVLFSAIMILVHAVCSHILPIFHIQFPSMTSNWFLLALEVPTITAAILYVVIYRARQRYIRDKINRRSILY